MNINGVKIRIRDIFGILCVAVGFYALLWVSLAITEPIEKTIIEARGR